MSPSIKVGVEVERFELSTLEPAAYNPRHITAEALAGLKESLGDLGLLEMPVVNVKDGKRRIVSGHQRIKALVEEGVTHADCVVVRFDEAAEMAANLSMNNPAIRGEFDVKAALPKAEAIAADLPKPDYMGFSKLVDQLREQAARLGSDQPSQAADEGTNPDDGDGTPQSKADTLYRLGRHRLWSGSFEKLVTLMGKKRAQACITDPPYGVAYEQAGTGDTIANDDLDESEWAVFLESFARTVLKLTDGPVYAFMSSKELPALQRAWEACGGASPDWMFWAKDRFTLGRGDYHHMHEPIMRGWRSGSKLANPETPRTNVFEFPKPTVNALHPTQKPVELIRALMLDATTTGDVVLEPFAGSGTTLVVAEELGRTCWASEIDLHHCDTIRRRWAEQLNGSNCDWKALTPAQSKK